MRIFYIFFFFGYSSFVNNLLAVLDGRTGNTPIELDTTYSFSNLEYALGYVKFENGFDIPTNGTVILGVNQVVSGPINFNNGTIILEKDIILGDGVTLNGLGYIKTNSHTIYLQGRLYFRNFYFFSDRVTFHGLGIGSLFAGSSGSHLFFADNNIFFKQMTIGLIFAEGFIFNGINDRILNLLEASLNVSNGNFTVERIDIIDSCLIKGANSKYTVLDNIVIYADSQLTIDTFQKVSTPQIILDQPLSLLILSNSTLVFTDTPAANYALDRRGRVFVEGKSKFEVTGSELIDIDPRITMFLTSGSRLELGPNVHLKIN